MRQLKAEYYKMKYSRASKWVLVFMAFIFFIPFVVGNDTLFMTFGDYRNIDIPFDEKKGIYCRIAKYERRMGGKV